MPTVPRAAPHVAARSPTTRPQPIAATGDGRTGGAVAAAATKAVRTAYGTPTAVPTVRMPTTSRTSWPRASTAAARATRKESARVRPSGATAIVAAPT